MNRLIAIALVCALLLSPLACKKGAPADDREAYAQSFAGTWETTWGRMTITVTGTKATAGYTYREGRLEASLSADGRSMEGWWSEAPSYKAPDDAGRMVFQLSKDGQSLDGYWWFGEDEDGGEWVGTRVVPGTEGEDAEEPDDEEYEDAEEPDEEYEDEDEPGDEWLEDEDEPGDEEYEDPDADAPGTGTPVAGRTAKPGLTMATNPDDDLLFYVNSGEGSCVYYYGLEQGGALQLSHILVEDDAGNYDVVIYDERLLPVQWILPQQTVAVYPDPEAEGAAGDEGWFDPRAAFHVVSRGEEEQTLTADIFPQDLGAVLDELEAATGQEFGNARAFLAAHDVTFEELVALARQKGPEQPMYVAAAAGFSAASAALSLERAGGRTGAAPRTRGLAAPMAVLYGDMVTVGAAAAGGVLADVLNAGLDPGDGPAVGVLLCRGAAKYGVCHYMFFHAHRLNDCVTLCQTSLGCFTDICMPMDISVEMAMSMRGGF